MYGGGLRRPWGREVGTVEIWQKTPLRRWSLDYVSWNENVWVGTIFFETWIILPSLLI